MKYLPGDPPLTEEPENSGLEIAAQNKEKGMYVGLKQPRGDGERCVTPARAAAKETRGQWVNKNVMPGNNNCMVLTKILLSIFCQPARGGKGKKTSARRASQFSRGCFDYGLPRRLCC